MKQSLIRYLPLLLLAAGWELAARLELVSSTALHPCPMSSPPGST